ncbi:MAG TPA: DciA family protein [Blastocatellia bacterium]|nr:DciA family protein [Blastocatellia bacterium]
MMTSLLNLLPRMLRHVGDSDEARQHAVFAAWVAAVGGQVRKVTQPLRLERKTLIVAVADQTWRTQLDRIKGQALFRLNSLLGTPAVTAIEFVINPDSLRDASPAAEAFHFVAPEVAALPLNDDAARINNPELREAFLRAAGKCLERRAK